MPESPDANARLGFLEMAKKPGKRKNPAPKRTPAPQRVRSRRFLSIIFVWVFIAVFIVGPVFLGNYLFVVPAIGFTVAGIATMRLARSPDGPDAETLGPDALAGGTKDAPVEVHATWSIGTQGQMRNQERGVIRVADRRISFIAGDGESRFDAAINKTVLASKPGFWRPQLDLELGGTTHSLRFFPLWDLGATTVGPIVAGEWYDQLAELGAKV
jgi:hypothetical protein